MKPISDQKRTEVLNDLAAGHTRNQIARDRHLSPSTISRVATSTGHTFDRASTEKATAARAADSRKVAADLVASMLANAMAMQARMFEAHTYRAASAGKLVTWTQDGPTPADMVRYQTLAGIAVDKHVALIRNDQVDQHLSDVDEWIAWISGRPVDRFDNPRRADSPD